MSFFEPSLLFLFVIDSFFLVQNNPSNTSQSQNLKCPGINKENHSSYFNIFSKYNPSCPRKALFFFHIKDLPPIPPPAQLCVSIALSLHSRCLPSPCNPLPQGLKTQYHKLKTLPSNLSHWIRIRVYSAEYSSVIFSFVQKSDVGRSDWTNFSSGFSKLLYHSQ